MATDCLCSASRKRVGGEIKYKLARWPKSGNFEPSQRSPFCFFLFHIMLQETCHLSQLVLLGHSIGGYVARLVPALYPETRPFLLNTVTLGSPHAHPVFGWEPTVRSLHQTYLQETASSNGTVLVAISGGIRDEMIPPVACGASHGLSVSATTDTRSFLLLES